MADGPYENITYKNVTSFLSLEICHYKYIGQEILGNQVQPSQPDALKMVTPVSDHSLDV